MAIELINEVLDYAPASLTAAERYALIILAEDARLPSREIQHDITDEYLLGRLRMTAGSWANMRSELVKKKVIERIEGGHNGKNARFKILVLNEAMKVHRSGEPTEPELHHRSGEPTAAKVHRSGESRFTGSVNLTYITPSTPSTTPGKRTGEGEDACGEKAREASALVASLPANLQPGRGGRADLVAAIAELLGLGWPAHVLATTLVGHTLPAKVHNLARLMITWLPEPEPYRPAEAVARASPKCPDCNGRGATEDDYGNPTRCPTCKPPRSAP